MSSLIEGKNITTAYGDRIIQDNVSFSINKSEIFGFLGGSGSGKTTLMKTMYYLVKPKSGIITMFDEDIWNVNDKKKEKIQLNCGVMFQFGALYSSMNVLENVNVLLKAYSSANEKMINDLSMFWIQKVGLKPETAFLYPGELSGGMKKRVALARALALTPKILFLDEPNSGLDPMSARALDRLIVSLRESLGITIVMVTHDIDNIFNILDRFLIIDNKKIIFEGNIEEVKNFHDNPLEELFRMRK